jgi:hypothetical protein
LQLLQDIQPVEQRLDDNRRLVAIAGALASLIAALGTWLVTGLVLQPAAAPSRRREGHPAG